MSVSKLWEPSKGYLSLIFCGNHQSQSQHVFLEGHQSQSLLFFLYYQKNEAHQPGLRLPLVSAPPPSPPGARSSERCLAASLPRLGCLRPAPRSGIARWRRGTRPLGSWRLRVSGRGWGSGLRRVLPPFCFFFFIVLGGREGGRGASFFSSFSSFFGEGKGGGWEGSEKNKNKECGSCSSSWA